MWRAAQSLAWGLFQALLGLDAAVVGMANAATHARPRARRLVELAAGWLAAAEVMLMVCLGLTGRPRAAGRMLLAVGAVYVAAEALGLAWRRPRPFASLAEVRSVVPHHPSRSFPSRHVASAVAMARVGGRSRPWLGRLMALLAGLLALGRVAAGIHYPSDVLAGVVLGEVIGSAFRDWP